MELWGTIIAVQCLFYLAACLSVKTHVPAHALTNGTAHLECVFKLEDERLQLEAVKWQKDHRTFYVYSPTKHPNGQLFSVPGVNANDVDVTQTIGVNSGEVLVRLRQVTPMSSGIYGCEVQTKDSVNTYGYPSNKEMIVRDPTTQSPNSAHRGAENSAAVIIVCVIISLFWVRRTSYTYKCIV